MSHEIVPISDRGYLYYHQALEITDPLQFLRSFNQLQPTLSSYHAHTHPPGAVLIFYGFIKVLRHPGLIALFIAVTSLLLTAFFFYQLLIAEVEPGTARYVTFLLLLIPAIQIYYLATLEALIAALFIGALYFFIRPGGKNLLGSLACLMLSFLLTFGTVVLLPVLTGFELLRRRSLKRSVFVVGGLLLIHIIIYALSGYDALGAFRYTGYEENPDGFMLLAHPANYFFTRLMNVAEILLFFGPFLLVLFVRGVRAGTTAHTSDLFLLTLLGCGSLLAFFATGALKSGETARVCLFIYPYLLFPIALYLHSMKATFAEKAQLAGLVFGQALLMQLFGGYFW